MKVAVGNTRIGGRAVVPMRQFWFVYGFSSSDVDGDETVFTKQRLSKNVTDDKRAPHRANVVPYLHCAD